MNKVILVRNTVTNKVVSAHKILPVSLAANFVAEEAIVYGPTAYGRMIVAGRYLSKEVVAQVWDALTDECPAPKRARNTPLAQRRVAHAKIEAALDVRTKTEVPFVEGTVQVGFADNAPAAAPAEADETVAF